MPASLTSAPHGPRMAIACPSDALPAASGLRSPAGTEQANDQPPPIPPGRVGEIRAPSQRLPESQTLPDPTEGTHMTASSAAEQTSSEIFDHLLDEIEEHDLTLNDQLLVVIASVFGDTALRMARDFQKDTQI